MRLYAFKPCGHGQYSFFVMAYSEAEARKRVEDYCTRAGLNGEYETNGWDTGYYKLTVLEPGEVITNDNS